MTDTPENQPSEQPGGDAPKNRADHLKAHRWKPGQSGNPKGRPKGRLISEAMRARARQLVLTSPRLVEVAKVAGFTASEMEGMTIADLLAEASLLHGLKGNPAFMSIFLNRVEGKTNGTYGGSFEAPAPPDPADDKQSPKDRARNRSLHFWQQIIDSTDTSIEMKLDARERLDVLQDLIPDKGLGSETDGQRAAAMRRRMAELEDATLTDTPDAPEESEGAEEPSDAPAGG